MNVLDGFSFNGRIASVAGFGMNRGGQPDWTFSKSGRDYSSACLYVFAECE